MKVLQIETIYHTAGISGIVLNLMEACRKNGDECKFVYGRKSIPVPNELKNDVYRFESDTEIRLHAVKSRLLDRSGFGSVAATKRLISYIKEYNPDVIHLHSLLGYYIDIRTLFRYLKESGTPVVYTQHDCWAMTGHCIHFEYSGCSGWKTGCGHCPEIRSYPKSLFIDNSAKNFREKKELFTSLGNMTLVVPSHWLGKYIEQSFLGKYPIKVIHNGINTGRYKPSENNFREKYNIGDKKLLLGVAGVWSPTKGLSYLLESFEMLGEDKYALVVIGADKNQIDAMPNDALGLPKTNDMDELIKWYSAADFFINPTVADNFPTVNLEALACGTPVVTFPTGGSPECLDETCGIVADEQSSKALVKAIKEAEERNFTEEACIERSKLFDKDKCFSEYVSLYHSISGK